MNLIYGCIVPRFMMRSSIHKEDVRSIQESDLPWERLSGREVLITGATGMVGSLMVDVLAPLSSEYGFELTIMSRNGDELNRRFGQYVDRHNLKMLPGDVNHLTDMSLDVVFHLASNTHPIQYSTDPVGTITTNVLGLRNLLEGCKDSDGRFVFASSVEIYGQNRGDVDYFHEGYCGYIDCNTVRAGYNESKRVGESLCQAYGSQYGVDFVTPRLSRLIGPTVRNDDSKALSQFIHSGSKGEPIVLKSDGMQKFSYCYSADAVSAILHLFFYGTSGTAYNVSGDDCDVTLKDLAMMISEITGSELRFEVPSEIECRGYSKATRAMLDTSLIKSIGWRSRYDIRAALERTITAMNQRCI